MMSHISNVFSFLVGRPSKRKEKKRIEKNIREPSIMFRDELKWRYFTSETSSRANRKCSTMLDVRQCQMFDNVRCLTMLDVGQCQMFDNVRCSTMLDVGQCQMFDDVRCSTMLDVRQCQMFDKSIRFQISNFARL